MFRKTDGNPFSTISLVEILRNEGTDNEFLEVLHEELCDQIEQCEEILRSFWQHKITHPHNWYQKCYDSLLAISDIFEGAA